MNPDNTDDTVLPNLPEKLATRVEEHTEQRNHNETILGNGDTSLTSEHPVSMVEYFLSVRVDEWAKWTYKDYSYDLTRFLEYCEYADQDDLSTLSSRELVEFKEWRKRDGNIGLATLDGQLTNIRVFIRWCESIDVVEEGLADGMAMPDLDPSDEVSYTRLEAATAEQIRAYYDQSEDVTRKFAEFVLMWAVLTRLGGVRSLDLDNYDRDGQYIELEHDPEEGTPLKNGAGDVEGEGGERKVNLPTWVCDILNTYIDGVNDPNKSKRIEVTDDSGREPLFTTAHGRVSETTVRRDIYRITQPCRHGQECPHDKDPNTCEARNDNNLLSRCPSNVSPHPVRRGGICHQISNGVSKDTICERADVTREVLNKHYDLRTKEEARKQRRTELREHLEGYDESPADTDSDQSIIQQEAPLLSTGWTVDNSHIDPFDSVPSQTRMVKGLAGYVMFVALVGLNLGLLSLNLA